MKRGVQLDAKLSDECLGNRLILNKEKTAIIKGSSLFKPYFKQYQKWRDRSIDISKKLLDDKRNIAFVNLDIKDYFSNVKIRRIDIYNPKNKRLSEIGRYNLEKIFVDFHDVHTEKLIQTGHVNFENSEFDLDLRLEYFVLPIGLLSSYVLANHYLQSFDQSILRHIKPAYYSRYVDDLLFVIADAKHPNQIGEDEFSNYSSTSDLSDLEKFILENFYPILNVDTDSQERKITLASETYNHLYCQTSKSLIYLFDANESHLVIDKLKEELEERTSEFRDFPDEEESKGTFTDAAYHLQYEDTKDKVRTLKDYKEDRFGLTIFLSNKIFSSLRQEEMLSDDACDAVLKFFDNKNAIEFFRLWEKIFTLFLVNEKTKHYVAFYLQCIKQIDNLSTSQEISKINEKIKSALAEYLDIANEITFSLNLSFYEKAFEETRNFEFKTEEWKAAIFFSIDNYEPTRSDSYWSKRFRKANMIRHHYVIHPLLNFTKRSRNASLKNLVNPHLNHSDFELDIELVSNSPRRINFWECNMAQIFVELNVESKRQPKDCSSNIFEINKKSSEKDPRIKETKNHLEYDEEIVGKCFLDDSYSLFKKINEKHISSYEFDDSASSGKNQIFKVKSIPPSLNSKIWQNEIEIGSTNKKSKFKIAFVNTVVKEDNIISSIRGKANLNKDRIKQIGDLIRSARKENADILLFPEFFIPLDLLSSIVDYAKKNDKMITTGLEHVLIGTQAYNFIVTIIPTKIGGVKDAIVVPRLKNHYAHVEKHLIEGNHKSVPLPSFHRYDLFIWKNLYFTNYYCFELADINHRALWKNKADLVIGVEWNKDTPYYSNIVEATSRDLHCYFAQVNTSQFGDSRLTKPVQSALKDVLRLKGGDNDALLLATFDTSTLREFQRKTFSLTNGDKEFKPIPPDFSEELVLRRINNQSVIDFK